MHSMKSMVLDVIALRQEYATLAAEWADRKAEFEALNHNLIDELDGTKASLSEAEDVLRHTGREYYDENPESKKLPHGLGIRITKKLVYAPDDALAWAKEHDMALALDTKAFEKIAKVSPPQFVTVEEVPSVTIPTKLTVE